MRKLQSKISVLFCLLIIIFSACLIVSNILAVKIFRFGIFSLPAAVIVFPITYVIGDVLTEVYGYRHAKLVIWVGFFANILVVGFIILGQFLPPAEVWTGQQAYKDILGSTPRLLAASFLAYLLGELLNSFVLAKLKVFTKGKRLWVRTIGSTLVGQFVDSGVFVTIAFIGLLPTSVLVQLFLMQWICKVAYEVLCTPVTYLIVNKIKTIENIDVYDYSATFNPLRIFDLE